MIRKLLYLMGFIFLGLLAVFVIGVLKQEKLNPQVADILTHSLEIDKKTMEQNAYVSFMGIDAPVDMDYFLVGKQIIIDNQQKIKAAIVTKDSRLMEQWSYYNQGNALELNYQVNGKDYQFPCKNLTELGCTRKIVEHSRSITHLIEKNHILLDRYKQIIKLPNYNGYFTSLSAPILNFQNMMRLTELRVGEAVLLINQDQVEKGIVILQEEIDFYKKILSGQDTLVAPMVAIRQLLTIYHVIEDLLDKPELMDYLHNEEINSLLKPLTIYEQQAIARALMIERNGGLYFYQSLINKDRLTLWFLLFDRNASLNKNYKLYDSFIQNAMLVLPEASSYYLQQVNKQDDKKAKHFLVYLMNEKGIFFLHNFYGEVLLNVALPNYDSYQFRLYDLSLYLLLVNTKLAIKQKGLDKQQVGDWLVTNKIVNPYNQHPLQWNEQQQMLSSDWLDDTKYKYSNNERDGIKPVIYIAF
ncbi:hypothetical protein MTZ49_08290 [Entomomonas sp. E2T0]|uniref:hypothetical protein n=1 Tax=Entomomonas sp. E2T0 TaxID=2930213 RepID=UPI0022281497|nr:hypothetical protein [Entomomonas sp. E2T0]UYZ82618.1 hypothetical protein MTZ49_08290 [Entomomonas sp. E2T0]